MVKRANLLRRLRNNPALPALVQSLDAGALHQLIDGVGLADAGEIMALASVEQLRAVLDVAVWKQPARDQAEQFDPGVFVDWLQTWLEVGTTFAAERLLALGEDDLAAYLSPLLRVRTLLALGLTAADPFSDGLDVPMRFSDAEFSTVIDDYIVTPQDDGHWDVLRYGLDALWQHDPDALVHLLGRMCFAPSVLGVHDHIDVLLSDAAQLRERAQLDAGYVTPVSARAFLQLARTTALDALLAATDYDGETAAYFRARTAPQQQQRAPTSSDLPDDDVASSAPLSAAPQADVHVARRDDDLAAAMAELQMDLQAHGIGVSRTQALLARSGDTAPLLRRWLGELAQRDAQAAEARMAELGYLANVVTRGIRSGDGALGDRDTADFVMAVASLGLDFMRTRIGESAARARLDAPPGVVGAFMLGWQLLGELPSAVLHAFESARAQSALDAGRAGNPWLAAQVDEGMRDLGVALGARDFEGARTAVTFLSIGFSQHACRVVAALLDECPRFAHAIDDASRSGTRFIRCVDDLQKIAQLLTQLQRAERPRRS